MRATCVLLLIVAKILTTRSYAAIPDSNRLNTASVDDNNGQAFMTPRFLRSVSTIVEKSNDDTGNEEREWDGMKLDDILTSLYKDTKVEEAKALLTMYQVYKKIGATALIAKLKG
ncbi:hypothetical protein PHMEG_00014204 [Phytophthora megakarya]|uniref:RxLR effector protein n=1 Tax=Phytophthora megakarya TaxID=4795 RepID=A0A225W4V4_9STRA|nr:hypothetical protein PHMEG_00014204 [Phytophthora megakarya]